MGDQWHWEGKELDPHEPYNGTYLVTGVWLLKPSIIGKNCLV
jgi:hypothetical protein